MVNEISESISPEYGVGKKFVTEYDLVLIHAKQSILGIIDRLSHFKFLRSIEIIQNSLLAENYYLCPEELESPNLIRS